MMHMNKPTQSAVGADNADEQIDPGIHMSDSPVMLSRSEASLRPARQTLRCGSG
jgi:hypothetical protein